MAESYSFDRPDEDSLIEFTAHLDGKSLTLVLDMRWSSWNGQGDVLTFPAHDRQESS